MALIWRQILFHLSLAFFPSVFSQDACSQSSCYPATGDLLIGREDKLSATSTCGLGRPERYCIVSHLEDEKKCFRCDSRQPYVPGLNENSHRIENVVYKLTPQRKRTWWQAQNGLSNVSIRLDLEAEFHFTHLVLTFKTFRPSAMLIERSHDFGRTWHVYRYFAYDCGESFPGVPTGLPRQITDVICESRYSAQAPSTDGEVVFRVLPSNIDIRDPYSMEVQNLLKMTNLRINFTKLHTLGDNLLDNRPEIREKYYYAIHEMVVRGSCSCYGHAARCIAIPGVIPNPDMVHGRCECTHNTKGLNCEQCEDFFNDLPWKPAVGLDTNACKRCECNSHATRCHFDPALFEATGRTSGGICDDCQHNTMGRNCEMCKNYFYHDPSRDITDSEACQPCDCDPRGSLNDGLCDSKQDAINDLEAGRCHCKRWVTGRRCDGCMDGYYDLNENNTEGCLACSCNLLGTIGNTGCDKVTGQCTCKRFVTGENCDQCAEGYWGMSADRDGCKACDCDLGGSYDNNCDLQTGQCRCRPNVAGRRCEQPSNGFFAPYLDYHVFEAEDARGSPNTRLIIRERHADRGATWTGPGFVQVSEGATLEFTLDNVPYSTEYHILVRYDSTGNRDWREIGMELIRPPTGDPSGPCANEIQQPGYMITSLPAGQRYQFVNPPVCLERGQTYTLKLDFGRQGDPGGSAASAVMIDSVAIIPNMNSIPFFQGREGEYHKAEFDRYRCLDSQLSAVKSDLHEVCRKYLNSISLLIEGEALPCECDNTGSHSIVCGALGGQCKCKPNVAGRTCDRCAPGTFGFGPRGCAECECNSIGSEDNSCDVTSGQCKCRPNTFGRRCDECQAGFYNYPVCERCQCSGRADICDPRTGACISCRDNTTGHNCERCLDGYYGDPQPGGGVPCRPCPCPGGIDSGFQHATSCYLDPTTQDVVCRCDVGYTGSKCERCDEGFFGNPLVPGGTCSPCQCRGNIEPLAPGSCDPNTGQCLKCLFNTEGFHCERCKAGYFGDARRQNCRRCVCDVLGTDPIGGDCDRTTGQCPCLPNVLGLTCDHCKENHWKLASGKGCDPCGCDPKGAISAQCDLYMGMCRCQRGRGGRTCSDCETNYWGDPEKKCELCQCNLEGSESRQCNKKDGSCVCLPGVMGYQCDKCTRGWRGEVPNCQPCGECFNNWDEILTDLKRESASLIDRANQVKEQGVGGAYESEFKAMEKKLNQVDNIVSSTNISAAQVANIQNVLKALKKNLTSSEKKLREVQDKITNATLRVQTVNTDIGVLQASLQSLTEDAMNLKDNATALQEANVEGALNLTKEAQGRSQDALNRVLQSTHTLSVAEKIRKNAEEQLKMEEEALNLAQQENEDLLQELDRKVVELNANIPSLNSMVCDRAGNPCDDVCGGAGCGRCGGLSCDQGALQKSKNALDLSKKAEEKLETVEIKAGRLLEEVNKAQAQSLQALTITEDAAVSAANAKNVSNDLKKDLESLLVEIEKFTTEDRAKPSDIRRLADEIKNMSISLSESEVMQLALQINQTILGLTNIDAIIRETAVDAQTAENVKRRAEDIRNKTKNVLKVAQEVRDALQAAKAAQNVAQAAISNATLDIAEAGKDLAETSNGTDNAEATAATSLEGALSLQIRLRDIERNFTENRLRLQKAETETRNAQNLADAVDRKATQLDARYKTAQTELGKKTSSLGGEVQTRATTLREKANRLRQETQSQIRTLSDLETQLPQNEQKIQQLSSEIDELLRRMNDAYSVIDAREKHYRTCAS
ncbi:laminin subunit beta-1-like [Paramacrobiotus metropolitanus]|uniref:laminin subunit beta-1-like n=1 Tax=Paramacrobiotus metropolitanus TaxID=2943436 RepID=UPI00244604FF|nr:laminin subunit beta-1-like [Paramacrobiotus metropolitanus]